MSANTSSTAPSTQELPLKNNAWTVVAQWDGSAPLKIKAEAAGDQPVVVLVQRTGYGPILAAAQIR